VGAGPQRPAGARAPPARVAGGGAAPLGAAPAPRRAAAGRAPIDQCRERWRDATLDHFTWTRPEVPGARTFRQRYFVCARHWRGGDSPILFYAGNEADVLL
jgi:hypothetical protein